MSANSVVFINNLQKTDAMEFRLLLAL